MTIRVSAWLMAGSLWLGSFSVLAGVSPYLPLQLNPVFELEIERLVTITGYPALKKPYHIATMVTYLDKVKRSHPSLYTRINHYIKRYKKSLALTHFDVELRFDDSTDKTLPNSRGRSTDTRFYSEFSGFWQPDEYLIANLSGGYDNEEGFLPFGSFISVGGQYLQLDLGYREHWLSPLQDSAMLLSTQAKPVLGVTLSNVKPITDWHINYELSFGKLEEVEGIRYQVTPSESRRSKGKPGFLTMHLSVQPTDWWTLGVNRTMQFGGGKRGKVGLSDVWAAIIDPVSSDNCGGESDLQDCNLEFGNQQASITSRLDLTWDELPYSLIFELAGEDTNNYKNYLLGNKAYTVGVFIPYFSPTESVNFTWQYIEDAWYIHHLYLKGYSNDNHKMGHWWGDEKQADDGIGAKIISLGYTNDLTSISHLSVKYHTVVNSNSEGTSAYHYERGHYAQVDYHWLYSGQFLGLHLYTGKDVDGDSFFSLAFSKQW